jgi:hypothetical protein
MMRPGKRGTASKGGLDWTGTAARGMLGVSGLHCLNVMSKKESRFPRASFTLHDRPSCPYNYRYSTGSCSLLAASSAGCCVHRAVTVVGRSSLEGTI